MPIYEYKCDKCGVFEVTQRITENSLKKCPTCKSKVERIISATSFVLKGTGWYVTDYPRAGAKTDSSTDSAAGDSNGGTASSSEASGNGDSSSSKTTSEVTKSASDKSSAKTEKSTAKADKPASKSSD
jgi:putative FmdB family regulatory protein